MKTKTFFTAIALTIGLLWSGPLRANDSVSNVADESEISLQGEETKKSDGTTGFFCIRRTSENREWKIQFVKDEGATNEVTLQYRTDSNRIWRTFSDTIDLNENQECYFRVKSPVASLAGYHFKVTGKSHCIFSGNLMSLLDPKMEQDNVPAGAFRNLFQSCKWLQSAEELQLPATCLGEGCYEGLFKGCSKLKTAPKLPATTLADGCYMSMFEDCHALKTAPELPATTLANSCYESMFEDCYDLTTAPKLPATELVKDCYRSMFAGCGELNYVVANFSDWNVEDATADWLSGVAEEGVFIYQGVSSVVRDASTVPAGWVVNPDYFTITAEEENVGVSLSGVESRPDVCVQYSVDRHTWVDYVESGNKMTLAHVGDKLYWRAEDKNPSLQGLRFSVNGKAEVSGNIIFLLDATGKQTKVPAGAFKSLFQNCQRLTKAPALPFTELGDSCYAEMFDNCRNLTMAPELPATELSRACYMSMFRDCAALTKAPVLAAEKLAPLCYSDMFEGCESLTKAPALPALTLTDSCYFKMFNNCAALTETPVLPATQMAMGCYRDMFDECRNLSKVYLAATSLTEAEASGWLGHVSATGIFYCPEEFQNDTHNATGAWGKPLGSGWKFNAYKSRVQLNAQGYATYSTPLAQRIVKGGEVAACRVNGVVVEAESVGTNIPAGEGVLLVGEPNATVELETLVFAYAPAETEALIQSDLTPATTVDEPLCTLDASKALYLLKGNSFVPAATRGVQPYEHGSAALALAEPVHASALRIVMTGSPLLSAKATISECGYTTLCVPFNASVPEETAVYALRRIDAEGLHFGKVKALVAGEGYVVEGAVGQTYTFTEVYDDVVDQNLLQGVTVETSVSELNFWGRVQEENIYDFPWILAKDGTFKRYTGGKIPAGKAYLNGNLLKNNDMAAGAMRVLLEEVEEEETSAITSLEIADAAAEEFYSLEGRRLAQPRRGAFCIERGRKIILVK